MSTEQAKRLAWLEKKEPNGLDESERVKLTELRTLRSAVPKLATGTVLNEEITPEIE